jgi:hypothetical protein
VRQDDNATGRCEQDVHGIPGVEVMLDSIHLTRTDKNGRFRFNRVREGEHRLEIRFRSEKPYFFTTPSELTTGIDQTVCFGVGFSLSRIIGYVKNDSGTGLPGLEIEIEGVRKSVAKTDANGRFTVDALLPGVYQVRINPDSVPPGYAVDTLETEALDIQLGAPGRVEFRLKPYRNLSGHVRIFDRISGTYKPAPGVTVLLMELARTTTSGEDGSYLFRDLSPGVHTLVVDYEGTRLSRTVTVEEHPSFLKNVDLHITAPERPAPSPTRVP